MDDIKTIFYELIDEAKCGKVFIDNEEYPIGFNTIIYNKNKIERECINDINLSTLVIKDKELFFTKLNEYVELELLMNRKSIPIINNYLYNKQKLLISYLFVNATTEDFLNPIWYIDRTINFLKDDTFHFLNTSESFALGEIFEDSKLVIKNTPQSILMETPNKIDISIQDINNENLLFKLPSISYGISTNYKGEKECFIYSILNPKDNNKDEVVEKYKKKISRKLYKINDGVMDNESKEFIDYKNNISSYYPENISDVSVSSVLSLTVFIHLLKQVNITNIKGVPYLPLRYLSRELFSNSFDQFKKEELQKRNNRIQYNITNKFIRTFRRCAYHTNDIDVVSFPYQLDEFLNIKLNNTNTLTNNNLLNEVISNINIDNCKKSSK